MMETYSTLMVVSLSKTLHLHCLHIVLVNPGKGSDMTEKLLTTVILFWILGSYLKFGKKIQKIGKGKTIFGLGMTP